MRARIEDLRGALGWSGALALVALLVVLVAVCAPQLLAPGDPLAIDPGEGLRPPSATHIFGTDESGRDLYTRVVHGAAASAGIGLAATAIGIGFGAVLGFLAGLGPRFVDALLGRVFEVLFALPALVMALLFIAVLGGGPAPATLAIGLATIPGYARMLRVRVRGIRESGYVEWARLDGAGPIRRFVGHVAPNSLWPLASAATLGVGQAIVWVSALGFLGLGAQPPSPEWGAMLNAGRVYLTTAWWMTVFPGLAIVVTAAALTVLGRRLGAPAKALVSRREARDRHARASGSLRSLPDPASTGLADPRIASRLASADAHASRSEVFAADATEKEEPGGAGATLNVTALTVALGGSAVLDGVSLKVRAGECLAVVGESGAGKSVLARTLLGLTQGEPHWRVEASAFAVDGVDVRDASQRAWRRLRGRSVSLVLQDALQSLDPLRTIGHEVGETLAIRGVPRADRRRRSIQALAAAGLPDPALRARQRSGQLSGGMRQRALIASALVDSPALVVADEPTTALDPSTAVRVSRLFRGMLEDGAALLLISHDLQNVARIADRVAVLDRGRIVETGRTADILAAPEHPATRELVAAIPRGAKPGATAVDPAAPVLVSLSGVSRRFADPSGRLVGLGAEGLGDGVQARAGLGSGTPGYEVDAEMNGLAGAVAAASRDDGAVRGVDLELRSGEAIGVVGESGAGKTTLARVLVGAERPDTGAVRRDPRIRIRLIPQDPLATFDPRWRVERIVAASRVPGAPSPAELLETVGLDPVLLRRRPATLSGGQRQRVAIARALAAEPEVLVCDEPVSALDVSTQAGILELLRGLQERRGLGLVFVSHDLAAVRTVCDRVLIMRDGLVIEEGPTERVLGAPRHPFTRELVEAAALR